MSLTSYDPSLEENALANPPILVPFAKIESILSSLLSTPHGVESLLDSQRMAFQNSSKKQFTSTTTSCSESSVTSSLPIQTAGQPPQPSLRAGKGAQLCIKTGYVQGGDTLVSKVAAGGGDTPGNTGVVLVFDQRTLRLNHVLCDEGLLTEVRTAAACAYASKLMLGSRRLQHVQKIGMVGGGVQACWQLRLLAAGVLPQGGCRTVVIKTRSQKSAEEFMERMKNSTFALDKIWNFEHYVPISEGGEAFQKCQLIHTVTPSRTPVLDSSDVSIPLKEHNAAGGSNFLHITAAGADCKGKCELDPMLIERAHVLVCDSIPQSKERGEFQDGRFRKSLELLEIGSMNRNPHDDDYDDDDDDSFSRGLFSIFDSSGLALQDLEMANLVSRSLC